MKKNELFGDQLLEWFARAGRTNFPWQHPKTAYRVWVSEIMLQQTQVATVIPYFERFVLQFSDIETLAAAPLDEVLHFWSGLGYYARARNLHKAAKIICCQHDKRFPEDYEQVLALPGIGPSTAGAVLSLALNQRHVILDGNVKRILTRLRCVDGWTGDAGVEKTLWEIADELTPDHSIADYNQAIMDLGATICIPTKPDCPQCPVSASCAAYARNCQHQYPQKRPKRTLPIKEVRMLLILDEQRRVLLERRPPAGIWGGLFGFPELSPEQSVDQWATNTLKTSLITDDEWPVVSHVFSHFRLDITPIVAYYKNPTSLVMDNDRWLWYNKAENQVGLAAPVQKLLAQLNEEMSNA